MTLSCICAVFWSRADGPYKIGVETDGISLSDFLSWDLVPVAACFILLFGMLKGVFKNSLNSQWLLQDLAGLLLGGDEKVWARAMSKSHSYNTRTNSSERSIENNKQIPGEFQWKEYSKQ